MKRKKASVFLSLLESWFDTYLPTAKGLSPATIKSYKTAFRVLFEFMYSEKGINAGEIRFEDMTSDIITEFLNWLEAERKCSISTRNHRLSVLNAFSEYAQNRDFEAASVYRASLLKIPQKKGIAAKRSYFTREEVKLLLSFPDTKTAIGKRDRALLCFMYASGARAQEVCELTVGDVTFFTDKATVKLIGKGRKVRKISIPADAAAILIGYIEYRKIQDKYDSLLHRRNILQVCGKRKSRISWTFQRKKLHSTFYAPHNSNAYVGGGSAAYCCEEFPWSLIYPNYTDIRRDFSENCRQRA